MQDVGLDWQERVSEAGSNRMRPQEQYMILSENITEPVCCPSVSAVSYEGTFPINICSLWVYA